MNVELTESERRAYRGVLDSLFVPIETTKDMPVKFVTVKPIDSFKLGTCDHIKKVRELAKSMGVFAVQQYPALPLFFALSFESEP